MSELHEKEQLRFYKALIEKLEDLRQAIDRNTEASKPQSQPIKKKEKKDV